MTNVYYQSADANGKKIIAAERISFGDWLTAREKLLNRLYPAQPATVQEILACDIRTRVLDLCSDLA
ncbi:MAG: hypothetical protein IKE43_04010 [Coriobacteriales bacterium]|nr:hypothetical protein [Coriobacteriales bacterium]